MPTLYIRNRDNTEWIEIGGTPGGGSPPSDLYGVPYVTMGNSGVTTAERALTAGAGIAIADGGANASVVVSCTVGGVDIVDIPFVTMQAVPGLNAERVLTAAAGIVITDVGPGFPVTVGCNWGAVPSTIEPDDAAAPGAGTTVARIDHVHAIVAAIAGTIEPDDAAAEGAATSFSRSDHQHAIVAAVPVDIANANAEGAATSFARSNHVHNHPAGLGVDLHHTEVHVVNSTGPHAEAGLTIGHVLRASGAAAFSFAALVAGDLPNLGGVPALTFGLTNAAGAAATYVQTDASLAIFDAVVPGTIQPDDAAAAGVVAFAARRDHQHAIVCAAPASPSVDLNASTEGTAYDFARSDHTHQLDQGIAPTWTQLHTFNLGLILDGPVYLKEQAAASADTPAYGQIWVKTATPNLLYFTDDAGTDFPIIGSGLTSFKSYNVTTQGLGAGVIIYAAGFYESNAADANLTNVAPTVTFGTANTSYAAHAFVVAGAAGTTDGSDLVLTVTGTSITDAGVRTGADSEVVVADCTAALINNYYETTKKWLGQITYTLSSTAGTVFTFDFNYGFAKYEDFGNRDFTVTDFEAVGYAGANEANLDIELCHHTTTGWTYSAAAFTPGPAGVVKLSTDHTTDDQLVNGEHFAYKRTGLTTAVTGSGSEGVLARITTTANNAIEYMNVHIGVQF